MKRIIVRASIVILLAIVLFGFWYSVAANYEYSALAGEYVYRGNGDTCVLYLRPDHTFVQELTRSGSIQKSQGNWLRYGLSHVSFSSEFLKMPGEELNASGEAHGEFQKRLGIFPVLILAPVPDGPKFQRKLFSQN